MACIASAASRLSRRTCRGRDASPVARLLRNRVDAATESIGIVNEDNARVRH